MVHHGDPKEGVVNKVCLFALALSRIFNIYVFTSRQFLPADIRTYKPKQITNQLRQESVCDPWSLVIHMHEGVERPTFVVRIRR